MSNMEYSQNTSKLLTYPQRELLVLQISPLVLHPSSPQTPEGSGVGRRGKVPCSSHGNKDSLGAILHGTSGYLQSPFDGCSESQSQNGWLMARCHMYVHMYVGKWSVTTYYSRNWHTQIVPGSTMDHKSDTEVLFEARHLYSDHQPPARYGCMLP